EARSSRSPRSRRRRERRRTEASDRKNGATEITGETEVASPSVACYDACSCGRPGTGRPCEGEGERDVTSPFRFVDSRAPFLDPITPSISALSLSVCLRSLLLQRDAIHPQREVAPIAAATRATRDEELRRLQRHAAVRALEDIRGNGEGLIEVAGRIESA